MDVIFGGVLYWFVLGFFYLIRLVWQDYKKMLVDDRFNYFMLGVTVSLLSHVYRSLWYILALVVLVLVIDFVARRYRVIGAGDLSAIRWVILGFGYLDPYVLGLFVLLWFVSHVLYMGIKNKLFKIPLSKKTPYFGVILVSFFIASLVYLGGVYLWV